MIGHKQETDQTEWKKEANLIKDVIISESREKNRNKKDIICFRQRSMEIRISDEKCFTDKLFT